MDNEENEVIDLTEILSAVRQHLLELIFVTLAAALVGFTASKFLMTPKYDSSALMIVNTRQDVNANVTSDQINSATKLVSTYSIIIKSDTVLQQVIDNLGLNLTYAKLNKRVTVAAVDDTQVMKITVQSDSPEWARQVCEQIITVAPDVIKEAVEAGSVKVISNPSLATEPVSPNIMKNTMLAAAVGFVLVIGIIVLQVLLDNKINTEEDVTKYLDMTVLGVIPQYDQREHHKLFMVGPDAPFQFTEAYKSLRTILEFLAATSDCKTILITSPVPGEGKSNVAVNLAITLADSGKRVVLVDCDMRKSTISRYLHIPRDHIGITNTITGKDRTQLANALVNFKDLGIVVLPVGTIPPNPSELLATKAMENTFEALKQVYDYIIVDTPPVSVVTDAAVLCKYADGALLVVRPGVTTIEGAQLSKKNLEAVNARILGVVMNGYNVKKAGKKDGYYYSYSYGYSNDDAAGKKSRSKA